MHVRRWYSLIARSIRSIPAASKYYKKYVSLILHNNHTKWKKNPNMSKWSMRMSLNRDRCVIRIVYAFAYLRTQKSRNRCFCSKKFVLRNNYSIEIEEKKILNKCRSEISKCFTKISANFERNNTVRPMWRWCDQSIASKIWRHHHITLQIFSQLFWIQAARVRIIRGNYFTSFIAWCCEEARSKLR